MVHKIASYVPIKRPIINQSFMDVRTRKRPLVIVRQQAVQQPELSITPALTKADQKPPRQRLKLPLQLALSIVAIVAAGFVMQLEIVGIILIALYAIWSVIRHIPSRTTFTLALIAFACILVMLLLRPDPLLMQNFAVYAFLFLLLGAMSLIQESRKEK